jgi:L-rhamnose mutarotase
MYRIALRMKVFPELIHEYQERHNPIWKELEKTFYEYGVISYSIFIDDLDGCLFAYAEIKSISRWNAIAETDVCKRWWKYMQNLMPTNFNNSPVTIAMREVFHIECLKKHK